MGIFGAVLDGGRAKKGPSPLKFFTCISIGDTRQSYTLPKSDAKIYKTRDTPLDFC